MVVGGTIFFKVLLKAGALLLGSRAALIKYGPEYELSSFAFHVNIFLLIFIVSTSYQAPLRLKELNVYHFGFIGPTLAVATGQPWIFFFSIAYLANVGQGLSHEYTGEQATLTRLVSLPSEYAHTVFFPNLLLGSVHESLFGKYDPDAKAIL